jgi:hypothetical protein
MIRSMETPHESVWLGVRGWRRPQARWFVLAALIVVLASAAICGAIWWARYQPIKDGCCSFKGHLGNRILYGWSIENTGHHTVRVTSVDEPEVPGFTEVRMFLGPKDDPGMSDVTHPLVPFDLAPGEQRAITVTGLVRCPKPNEGYSVVQAARVHFTTYMRSHAAWIEVGHFPIRPPPGTCRAP